MLGHGTASTAVHGQDINQSVSGNVVLLPNLLSGDASAAREEEPRAEHGHNAAFLTFSGSPLVRNVANTAEHSGANYYVGKKIERKYG